VQATRIRPDTRPTDLRRLIAAGLSALLPGLGQLFNRRPALAMLFLVPSLILIAIGLLLVQVQSPARLAAWMVTPQVLGTLLTLNLVILAWRLLAVGQAFLDTRRTGPAGWLGIVGVIVIGLVVAVPHLAVYRYGSLVDDTFKSMFSGAILGATDDPRGAQAPTPADDERINVLLVGIDSRGDYTADLTDTMMVASLDPVGHTVSLVSIPRDLVSTPLGNGDVFGPKINSLYAYAQAHPDEFPAGGMRTLQGALGALLDIPIQYYARVDFKGFVDIVDAVGGVDIVAPRSFDDPTYPKRGRGERGFSITAGPHHLGGKDALAYARSRKALGESDFTRQARQQQILVALKAQATKGGSLLFQLPDLLAALGRTIHTDVPIERLPDLASIIDEVGRDGITSVVIRAPLVHGIIGQYGSSQEPRLARIRAMAAGVFSDPGTPPVPWPTAKSSSGAESSPSP
jgi:polyisoprenyl-teichoic acid--peptidoglycan teichoic acid transferase